MSVCPKCPMQQDVMMDRHDIISKFHVFILVLAVVVGITWLWLTRESTGLVNKPEAIYDFIIVGGGTAGCVLAARLSEKKDYKVLLIEAGSEPPWLSSVPLAAPLLQKSKYDWAYKTVKQEYSSYALHNRESSWPRGKMLGGSSQLNFNIHSLGLPTDYDRWVTEFNLSDWSFEKLQRYAYKIECFHIKPKQSELGECHMTELKNSHCQTQGNRRKRRDGVHCANPPVRKSTSSSNITQAFLKAGIELGLPTGNLNSDIDYGISVSETTVQQGKKWSAFNGYLHAAMARPNLHILRNAQVKNVIIKEKRAIGVEYFQWDNPVLNNSVYAKGEVILSAGTVNTPLILLHSGIGNTATLHKHKIPVIQELDGVGQNLADHLNVPLYVHLEAPISLNPTKLQSLNSIWDYFVHGKGPLATAAIEGIAAVPTTSGHPEIGLIVFNLGFVEKEAYSSVANIKPEYFDSMFPGMKNESSEGIILLVYCLQPKSRGYVSVQSSDIKYPPYIQPNYLEHSYDVTCLRDAIKFAIKIISTNTFKDLGAKLSLPEYTDCTPPEDITNRMKYNDYLSCIVKVSALTGYHPVGTARMGDDPMSVTNSELQVRGLESLRIVDASVMPTPVSGAPNSVVMMISEQASDLIKEKWSANFLRNKSLCDAPCEEDILKSLQNDSLRIVPTISYVYTVILILVCK